MKIVVIGHLCLDIIHHPDKAGETRSYGGVFFALGALANLVHNGTSVVPIFGIGSKEYDAFLERLQAYGSVDTSTLYKISGPTNEVHLYYQDDERRTECSKDIAEPVPWKRIKPHLDADMILINMISGFDIALETLDQIRMAVRERHVPVYFDVHSLTLGIHDDFTRFRRPIPEWRRWLFWLHAAQMNEEEAAGLTSEKFEEDSFAKQVTALNTTALIITRGSRGCRVYIDERKKLLCQDVPGVAIHRGLDATGCGDVFGAAYCAAYLRTGKIIPSVEFANEVAALKATTAGSTDIDQLARYRVSNQALQLPIVGVAQ